MTILCIENNFVAYKRGAGVAPCQIRGGKFRCGNAAEHSPRTSELSDLVTCSAHVYQGSWARALCAPCALCERCAK